MSSAFHPLARARRAGAGDGDEGLCAATEEEAVRLHRAQARIGRHIVWSEVSVTITQGEFAAILGPNGSGKTTLLQVLLGELALEHGSASVLGMPPGAPKSEIGYLPQRRHFDPGSRIRGIDLVRLGLDGARWGLPLRRAGAEQVAEALDLVGAAGYARRPIGRLSGGEQQRLPSPPRLCLPRAR